MIRVTGRQPWSLVYDPEVKRQLRAMARKHHSVIRSTIEDQLLLEPETETRNRRPLEHPVVFEAEWELRFGPDNLFRVFYAVDRVRREVQILAVGVKVRNRLTVGKQEIEL